MKRAASPSSSRFLLSLTLLAGLLVVAPIEEANANNVVSAACQIGSSSLCPAQSPQEIVNLYGTTTNGSYWMNINGIARETFLILNSGYPDSGGWFLGMKGTRVGTSFTYSSTQWTDQTTTLNTTSLTDDVSTEAKFHAFNHLPVTRLVAVFKDRASQVFNTNGSGDLGTNSFGGHTWNEAVTSTSMFSRFTTNSNIVDGAGYTGRFTIHRETNASNGKLVFPYQTGWTRYGFNNTTGYSYRWGTTSNNEGSMGSNDSGSGIGMDSYSAAGLITYSDNLTFGPNGASGAQNPGAMTMPSGFQIWGKMAAPSIATPGSLSISNLGSGSVRINFAAASGATEYAVQYKSAGSNWNSGTTVLLTNPSATPSATLTGVGTGSYDFRVFSRASNNSSAGNSFLLAQSVDSTAPTITGPSSTTGSTSSISIQENSTAVHTFTANETVTWSKSGTDNSFFSITSAGVLTITARNFESPADSDLNNTYIVAITATDTVGNLSSQTLTVIITNVNEAPSITNFSSNATASLSQAENITSVATYSATDPDVGAVLRFSISGTDAADFSIDSVTGVLAFAVNPDFEAPLDSDTNSAYIVIVTVSDGFLTDTQTLTMTITNVNESSSVGAPTFSGSTIKGVSVTISMTSNVAGRARFFLNGKRIPSCLSRPTSGSYPNFTVTCSWKPPVTGRQNVSAAFTPADNTFSTTNSPVTMTFVGRRVNPR